MLLLIKVYNTVPHPEPYNHLSSHIPKLQVPRLTKYKLYQFQNDEETHTKNAYVGEQLGAEACARAGLWPDPVDRYTGKWRGVEM